MRRAAPERALAAQIALAERGRARLDPSDVRELTFGTLTRSPVDDPSLTAALDRNLLAWFEAERLTLVAGVRQAGEAGLPELAWELASSLPPHIKVPAFWRDWLSTHELAAEASRRNGSRRRLAHALWSLAACHLLLILDHGRAKAELEECLSIFRDIGDRYRERYALLGLAWVLRCQRDHGRRSGPPREVQGSLR